MKNMLMPNLFKLFLNDAYFYVLEHQPIFKKKNEAVIFLHGLGESRIGFNYLYKDLSDGLNTDGYTTYRFDLGGCGNSTLPLSIEIWSAQLETLIQHLNEYSKIHIVARGTAALILNKHTTGHYIVLNPPVRDFILSMIDKIPAERNDLMWIPHGIFPKNVSNEYFWFNLGVESRCLGGFYLTNSFLDEIKNNQFKHSSTWQIIFSGDSWPIEVIEPSIKMKNCHPLFLYQKDRTCLLEKIKYLLNGET